MSLGSIHYFSCKDITELYVDQIENRFGMPSVSDNVTFLDFLNGISGIPDPIPRI